MENRVERLVMNDGSFSQYSVNYHRLMLDSISWCEYLREQVGESTFSATFYRKMKGASEWLRAMCDEHCGDVPNLGANDGARLLPLPRH